MPWCPANSSPPSATCSNWPGCRNCRCFGRWVLYGQLHSCVGPLGIRDRFLPVTVGFGQDLFNRHAHQSEGIRGVTRPVVVRPQSNATLFVFLFVVPTQCFQTALRMLFAEPYRWEMSACSLDAFLGSALSLVRYNRHVIARGLKRGFIRYIEDLVIGLAVMRQPYLRALWAVAAFAHPLQMRREWLTNCLVIVNHADFLANELCSPDRYCVGSSSSAANVEEQAHCHQRIDRDAPYAPSLPRLVDAARIVGAIQDDDVATLPDVLILFGLLPQTIPTLLFEISSEPTIVAPVGSNHGGSGRPLGPTQHHIHWIYLTTRVPGKPPLGTLGSNRGT